MAKKAKFNPQAEAIAFITPTFVMSYPHLFKKASYQGKPTEYYTFEMLFKKDTDMSGFKKAINEAKRAAFGPDKTLWPEIVSPWKDGDEKEDSPEYAGMNYAKGKSKKRVVVLS